MSNPAPVAIDMSGRFKYILVRVKNKDGTECLVVRGYASARLHSDIYMKLCAEEKTESVWRMVCLGGGRMEVDPDAQTIELSDKSVDYGMEPREKTADILQKEFEEYAIIF